ncbi:hypothetical protein [Oculatella sp. LEGE 06141]|nr:hypothetical protein [Oculatella sp. LEGE 06141]
MSGSTTPVAIISQTTQAIGLARFMPMDKPVELNTARSVQADS